MPYKILKKKCRQSSGKKGKYIIVKNSDNKKQSCHASEKKAKAAIKARYANESILTEYIKLLVESNDRKNFKSYYLDAIKRREEAERLEDERLEAERLEAERLEAERLKAQRLEAQRLKQLSGKNLADKLNSFLG